MFAVFLILAIVYGATAHRGFPTHADTLTNTITSWYLASEGSPLTPEHEHLTSPEQAGYITWFVRSPRGVVSQYPPGTAALAAPAYAITDADLAPVELIGGRYPTIPAVTVPLPPLGPGRAVAVIVTALAMAILALVMVGRDDDDTQFFRDSVRGGLVAGLATGAWSVASNRLWPHGPAMLCIALALLAASRQRWLLCGVAFGAGVLVRPHVAVVAAVLGCWVAWRQHRWRPMALVAIGTGVGVVILLAYNYWLWGVVTVFGGYGSDLITEIQSPLGELWWPIGNMLAGLIDPGRGLLVWAPFLLVLVPAALRARRDIPDWAVGAALGGLGYLLVQWSLNRFTGGGSFFAYRYPLEAMAAASPMLHRGYEAWIRGNDVREAVLRVAIVAAVAGQGTGAILT